MLSLFLMPFIGRWELGHRFNVVWTIALLDRRRRADGARLARGSQRQRRRVAALSGRRRRRASTSRAGCELAGSPDRHSARRARWRCLRSDPKTQGPKLFRQHCAACHSHAARRAALSDPSQEIVAENPTAPNLWGFGSRDWVPGFSIPSKSPGRTTSATPRIKEGEMVTWVKDTIGSQLADLKGDELAAFRRKVEDVTFALAAEAGLIREKAADTPARVAAGREAIVNRIRIPASTATSSTTTASSGSRPI